jgi:hypothetical protein
VVLSHGKPVRGFERLNLSLGQYSFSLHSDLEKTMTVEPISDHDQYLPPPAGKIIGFVNTNADFETFTKSLHSVGFPASRITSIQGEDGLHLLDRLQHRSFFFSDCEDGIIRTSINELQKGHYAVAVDNRADAFLIADMAKRQGGHGFSYFGTWVTERLS